MQRREAVRGADVESSAAGSRSLDLSFQLPESVLDLEEAGFW
jgi:hypothetical protein